jgi:hypothetical protein
MSASPNLGNACVRRNEKYTKHDWSEAADHNEKALGAVRKNDFQKKGEINERIGYCLYCSAFQAETNEAFKRQ